MLDLSLLIDLWQENNLGFIAGLIVSSAAIPQVVRNIVKPDQTTHQSYLRNVCTAVGNLLWVVHGFNISSEAVSLFCGITCVLHLVILTQMGLAKRHAAL